MSKHSHIVGFSFLLVILLLPNNAVAAGSSGNTCSPLVTALDQFLRLVSDLVLEVDIRSGIDPWGCPAGMAEGELGSGIDPWGLAAPADDPNEGDLGHGWDPWGDSWGSPAPAEDIGHLWDPWG